jgi:hypothetical protein
MILIRRKPLLYRENCSPCLIPYDAVVKLDSENLSQEEAFVMENSGMNRLYNLSVTNSPVGGKTSSRVEAYYSTVSCDIVAALLKVYQADMELFDYSAEPYMTVCQK